MELAGILSDEASMVVAVVADDDATSKSEAERSFMMMRTGEFSRRLSGEIVEELVLLFMPSP
jgi:hypothetical protein